MAKTAKFALMNVLIKGTAASIQAALAKINSKYELKAFGFNSDKVDPADTAIVKAGLVFDKWYEGFITPDEIPFAAMSDIKFIGLGNGGDGSRTDGSYVFYKDFGETCVSECYQFSGINPQMEEFEAQEDVLENVCNSFMDHAWQYRYEDYSCGEYIPWEFNKKKDKTLIAKWKSDENDNSKNVEKNVAIGGMDNVPFSYEHIDGISPAFYEGIFDGKDFAVSPDEVVNVNVNGTDFVITIKTEKKVNTLLKKFKKALAGKDVGRPLYDPVDVVSGKYTADGTNEYGQDLYNVSDNAEILEPVQIAHRTSIFAKINNLLRDEKAAAHIVEAAPKKKNGTFALKRVTQVASLFCMEDDASMYVLCAVAKADNELSVEVRQIAAIDMEKTYTDVISVSNLFRKCRQENCIKKKLVFLTYKPYDQETHFTGDVAEIFPHVSTTIQELNIPFDSDAVQTINFEDVDGLIYTADFEIFNSNEKPADFCVDLCSNEITILNKADYDILDEWVECCFDGINEFYKYLTIVTITSGDNTKSEFKFEKMGDSFAVTGYRGKENDIVIPAVHNGVPVTAVWGMSGKKMESVRLEDGIKIIGMGAFINCRELSSIIIPESLTEIGSLAFKGCKKLADENGFVVVNGIIFDSFKTEKDGCIDVSDYTAVGNYRMAPILYRESVTESKEIDFTAVDKGGNVEFGHFPQTQNCENKSIKWIVLEKSEDRMLLVAEKCLIKEKYKSKDNTWENSNIKKWLEKDFVKFAFSAKERNAIESISLLSSDEVQAYFEESESRIAQSTNYSEADFNIAFGFSDEGRNVSWLLKPCSDKHCIEYVQNDGKILQDSNADDVFLGIRPILIISCK